MTQHYAAPWGTSVKIMTGVALVALTAVVYIVARSTPPSWVVGLGVGLATLVLGGCAAFSVRGYSLSGHGLVVRRRWVDKELSLSGLRSVEPDPSLVGRSFRLLGNGGLFGFTGWFWNRTLGRYRAFVTAPRLSVVLRFADHVVVVSPDPRDDFVRQVRAVCRLDD